MSIAIVAPKAVAPLFTTTAIVVLLARLAQGERGWRPSATEWALGGFLILSLASVSWSITPSESARTFVSLAATFGGSALLVRYADTLGTMKSRTVLCAIVAGGFVVYAILCFEYISNGTLIEFAFGIAGKRFSTLAVPTILKPALAVGVLFFWPWAFAVSQILSAKWTIGSIASALIALVLFDSHTAILALVVGAVCGLMVHFLPKLSPRLLGIGVIVLIFTIPLLARQLPDPTKPGSHLAMFSNSAIHRIDIWRTAASRIAEEPILGLGFDTARALYGANTSRVITLLPDVPERTWNVSSEPIPLHPHNLILQIWLELGILGATALCVFLLMLGRLVAGYSGKARFMCFGLLGSTLLISNIGFGAWQSWWLSSIALSLAATTAVLAALTGSHRPDAAG